MRGPDLSSLRWLALGTVVLSQSSCWVVAILIDKQMAPTAKQDCEAAERACARTPDYHCYVAGLCWEEERGGRRLDLARAAADFARGCEGGAENGCVSLAFVLSRDARVAGTDGPARARAALLRACRLNWNYCLYVAEAADQGRAGFGFACEPAIALDAYRRVCFSTRYLGCERAAALQRAMAVP